MTLMQLEDALEIARVIVPALVKGIVMAIVVLVLAYALGGSPEPAECECVPRQEEVR